MSKPEGVPPVEDPEAGERKGPSLVVLYGLVALGMVTYGPRTFVEYWRLNSAFVQEMTRFVLFTSETLNGIGVGFTTAALVTVTVMVELLVLPRLS